MNYGPIPGGKDFSTMFNVVEAIQPSLDRDDVPRIYKNYTYHPQFIIIQYHLEVPGAGGAYFNFDIAYTIPPWIRIASPSISLANGSMVDGAVSAIIPPNWSWRLHSVNFAPNPQCVVSGVCFGFSASGYPT
jgi:hypothetical protein